MKKLISLTITMLLLSGCLASKKISEKTTTTKETEKIEKTKDSSSVIEINKAIKDEAIFKIPESNTGRLEFDKAVNEGMANLLRNINFNKSSGDNSYRFYYDEKLKAMRAEFEIGQTQNREINVKEKEKIEKTFEQNTDEYIYKKIISVPWWMWAILVYIFRFKIFDLAANIFPPLKGVKLLSKLNKNHSKEN